MRPVLLFLFAIVSLTSAINSNTERLNALYPKRLTKFGFGSCDYHYKEQPFWATIAAQDLPLWLWTGDAIYADHISNLIWVPAKTEEKFRESYTQLKNNVNYSSFIKKTAILGTWDDHDFGANNGNAHYQLKQASQRQFLDFIDEEPDSERRRRDGVYTSQSFGQYPHNVVLVLLDVRYFRTDDDILGDEQWRWLEGVLSSPAALFIIVSGTQVLTLDKKFSEKWGEYPQSVERLFRTLTTKVDRRNSTVIFLSGDVHYGEVLRLPSKCTSYGIDFIEFTSSGLTHSACSSDEKHSCHALLDGIMKTKFRETETVKRNFGVFEIDWEASPAPLVTVKLLDVEKGRTLVVRNFHLTEFRVNGSLPVMKDSKLGFYEKECGVNLNQWFRKNVVEPIFSIWPLSMI